MIKIFQKIHAFIYIYIITRKQFILSIPLNRQIQTKFILFLFSDNFVFIKKKKKQERENIANVWYRQNITDISFDYKIINFSYSLFDQQINPIAENCRSTVFQIGSCEWIINNGESWPSNMRIRSLIWIIVNVTITWLRIIIPMLSENNYSFADLSRSTNFFEPSNISNKSESSWLFTCRYCYFHHFFFN